MEKTKDTKKSSTGRVTVDNARIDRLKEQHMSTPAAIDNERVRFMMEVYENTAGYQNIIRRAKFLAHVLENKKLYIDENLFVGSMASSVNAVYTYPEWNVEWMKEEKTVEKSKTPEDRKANQWALEYWDKRSLKPRSDEIFTKKYGYDPNPSFKAGLVAEFTSWPGGGGNLNYPRVYNEGLASMIKEVEERKAALDMLLPNAPKFYFYEASLIVMRAVIRFAHRYAELAREMAAKEKNETRKAELIAIAETCEWVPEHPARNLREAIQAHFLCHICSRTRAGRMRIFRGLPWPEHGAVLSGRQGCRPDRSRRSDFYAQEPLHQAERNRLLLRREGCYTELCRPGSEHLPRRLYRERGRRYCGNGLPGPRCLNISASAPAPTVVHIPRQAKW